MLGFKAQFPISNDYSLDDLLEAGRRWISGNPHSSLSGHFLDLISIDSGYKYSNRNEMMEFLKGKSDDVVGFCHEKIDDEGVRWLMEVVGVKRHERFLISVVVSSDSDLPVDRLVRSKKPYIIRNIIEGLGGGYDGILEVSDRPYYLDDDEIDFAADLINADAGCSMPVVYVSVKNDGSYGVDPERLSRALSGMAHVVVEPNRAFSFVLKDKTQEENVYDGGVGIYWPTGIGRWLFLQGERFPDKIEMFKGIVRKIHLSLLTQRISKECSWVYLQEILTIDKINELKSEGSAVQDYINVFDEQIKAKDQEILRLNAQLYQKTYNQKRGFIDDSEKSIKFRYVDSEKYRDEYIIILRDILEKEVSQNQFSARRLSVIGEIIDNNECDYSERDKILEELKAIFKDYTNLDASKRKRLEALGFSVGEDGAHYKLHFHDDKRFPVTIAKTASDYRAGRNILSDIKRALF